MPYEGNHLVVTKSNAIVEASYRLTLQEQRVVLYCVAQVDSRSPLDEQRCFVIEAGPFRNIYGIAQEKVYEELKDAGKRLFERKISLVDHETNQVTLLRWVSLIRYHKRQGKLTLHFSPELLPFISALRARFTSYPLAAVAALSTSFAIRLFEILAQYRTLKRRVVTVEDLRRWLDCTETFARFSDFDRWVIKPSVEQINERTMLKVEADRRKSGRQVTEIEFRIDEDRGWKPPNGTDADQQLSTGGLAEDATAESTGKERRGRVGQGTRNKNESASTRNDSNQASAQHGTSNESPAKPALHPVLKHFYKHLLGAAGDHVTYVSAAELAFAVELTESLGGNERAVAFVDFALTEARRSNFNVKTLRGLAQYVPFWQAQTGTAVLQQTQKSAPSVTTEDTKRRLDSDRERLQSQIDSLTPEETEALMERARSEIHSEHPPSAMSHRLMLDLTFRRLVRERFE